jgi:hypothetical protein
MFLRGAIVALLWTSACSQTDGHAPARAIPTHVRTAENSASPIEAEQGDFLEVRLDSEWRLARIGGEARIEKEDETVVGGRRVFRFRALGIGRGELVFAADPRREIVFHVIVR